MLIDIGGGVGHEIQAIKQYYPSLPGRLILQDTPETIKRALPIEGMETMEYDFFTKQPVTGISPPFSDLPPPFPACYSRKTCSKITFY